MPNGIAYLALLAWPVVVAILFTRLPPGRALIWSILGGYLLLPPVAQINLPGVPAFDKVSIPNLAALLALAVALGAERARARLRATGREPAGPFAFRPLSAPAPRGAPAGTPPLPWFARLALALFVVGPFVTVLTNAEPVAYPGATAPPEAFPPGLRLRDSVSAVVGQAIFLLPFFLARRLLADAAALRDLLRATALAGLAYSLPMLLEVRLSPQLNVWIYGFFQHDFLQMMRGGGFRPIVFLEHGLWVAFFAMTALVAAAAAFRHAAPADRPAWGAALLWLGVTLVLCKTLGPLLYAALLLPLVLVVAPRWQVRIAAVLGALALAYPLLRGAGLVPTGTLVAWAEAYHPERAQSLAFRFMNEDLLLARAAEKPWFGWGGWGRNHLHDLATGRMATIADGRWIIVLGMYGYLGYIAEFGLLALPLVLLARHGAAGIAPQAGALALLLAVNMVDLLPNATLTPLTWLVAGALLGHAEAAARARAGAAAAIPAELRQAADPAGRRVA